MNLANAQLMSGESGELTVLNPNHDANLPCWFKWVPQNNTGYFFSTRGTVTDFRSRIRVYTLNASPHSPVQMSDLTEVTTFLAGGVFPNGYGYEFGALVAFSVTNALNTTYYFSIDSRDGTLGGNLQIDWGVFYAERLGGCNNCSPAATGLCKVAGGRLADGTYLAQNAIGSGLPSGYYFVTYCSGAFTLANGTYTGGGVSLLPTPNVGDIPKVFVEVLNNNIGDIQRINACKVGYFTFAGGTLYIQSGLAASSGNGNFNNPSVAVFIFQPESIVTLALKSIQNLGFANGVDASAGYNYRVTITARNPNINFQSGRFWLKLLNAGGISSDESLHNVDPGGDGFGLRAGISADVTFTFSSAATDVLTGVFQFVNSNGDPVAPTRSILLAQGGALSIVSPGGYCSSALGGGQTSRAPDLYVGNSGVIPVTNVSVAIQVTGPAGLLLSDPSNATPCAGPFTTAIWQKTYARIEPAGVGFARPAVKFAAPVIQPIGSAVITYAGNSLPAYTVFF